MFWKKKNWTIYQSEIELKNAKLYELDLQRKGMIKDIKTYNKMLDEYASLHGYWNWNEMIEELSRC